MSTTDRRRIEKYEPRVTDELAALDALIAGTADDSRPVELDQQSVGRVARMDAMQRQAMAAETERRRRHRRQRLQQTLARMARDEFGYCETCGDEIPDRRLDIDPTFHLCVRCAD